MKQVDRHAFNAEAHRPLFPDDEKKLDRVLSGPPPPTFQRLTGYARRGLEFLELASVFGREHRLLRPAARMVAQGQLAAVLLGAAERGTPVEFALGDGRATIPAIGPNADSSVVEWTRGWYGALLSRDTPSLDGLRAIPSSTLRMAYNLDDYHYAWKEALAAVDSQPADAIGHLERAIQLTSQATIAAPGVPERAASFFPMLRGLVERNAALFNDALFSGLEAHKAFASETPHGPPGWIAFGPLALCCLAHDRGIPIEVESEYLLPALMRGA